MRSIVDLVFSSEPPEDRRWLIVAAVVVFAFYAGLFKLVSHLARSPARWSAELAGRIHEAIAIERAIDLTPLTPPTPPSPALAQEPPRAAPARARPARSLRPASRPPAQAGQLAAASPELADFTGTAFVVGSGATYAGGSTTSQGTSRVPVSGDVAHVVGDSRAAAPGGTRSRPVSLDGAAWSCPWPAEADAHQVNEETVVLRAAVRADGRAERVELLADPGFGFGAAARLCALGTRFDPARDPAGQRIAALSPPIRVHFFR